MGIGGLLVLLAAVSSSREATNGLAVVWVTVSASVREGLFVAGPVAGLTALVVASRFNTPRSIILPVSATRAGSSSVRRHLTVLTASAAVAYTLGQLPGFATALEESTYGGPDLLVIASAYPVLAAYVAIGYLIGTLLPGWKGGVAGLTLMGLMSVLGGITGSRWWAVAPVWTYGLTRAGFHDSRPLTLFRLLFFTLLALAVARVGAGVVTHRRAPTRRLAGLTLRYLSPVLLIALIAGLRAPAIQYREPDPVRVCGQVSETTVCVHAAHRDLLPSLLAVAEDALDVAGTDLSRDLGEILDQSLLPTSDANRASIVLLLSSDKELREGAAIRLSGWLARVDACTTPPDGTISESQQINEGIQLWIYRQIAPDPSATGYFVPEGLTPAVADRLANMSQVAVEAWIDRHIDAITDCGLQPDDLP